MHVEVPVPAWGNYKYSCRIKPGMLAVRQLLEKPAILNGFVWEAKEEWCKVAGPNGSLVRERRISHPSTADAWVKGQHALRLKKGLHLGAERFLLPFCMYSDATHLDQQGNHTSHTVSLALSGNDCERMLMARMPTSFPFEHEMSEEKLKLGKLQLMHGILHEITTSLKAASKT